MAVPADRSPLRVEGRALSRARSCSASSSETAAERLTDDLLLEILPRVPAKSLCDFSSTSTNSVPETIRQPPVLLARIPGSFCPPTSLAFLPNHQHLDVLDCCSGLLLCRWYGVSTQIGEVHYIVCNPATEKWVAFPDSGHGYHVAATRLGFDPAQSSHFHVLELFEDLSICGPGQAGVAVYSSESRGWVHMKFSQPFMLAYLDHRSVEAVFFNRHLYFHVIGSDSSKGLAAVDTQVETWTNLGAPDNGRLDGFIQCSQGRMHYANFYVDEDTHEFRLGVYVLENYETKEWTLKHMVDVFYIIGEINATFVWDFEFVGIHPECNLIFFTTGQGEDTTLKCYEMDFEQVKVICNLKDGHPPYLRYVPLYAELQSLHM